MGDATENNVIEKLLQLKEHYNKVRRNTCCRITEMDNCDSCRADHYFEARLTTVDDCILILRECGF